jgi:hypothetical protein
MSWDASRPVPWQRLMREWVIYAGIMLAALLLLFRGSNVIGAIAGVLVSGPLYLLFGFVLAKFGYNRKTLKEMRAEREKTPSTERETDRSGSRIPPPPTRRTSTGHNRPTAKQKRR